MMHVQPPIPEPAGYKSAVAAEVQAKERGVEIDPYDISSKNEVAVAAGTNRWCMFDIGGKVQRARGCWVKVLKAGVEDGEEENYWPKDLRPWSFGGWMEDATLEIEEPLEWKL